MPRKPEGQSSLPDSTGLYLHVPFCPHICSFCPYHKLPYDAEQVHEYMLLLQREWELVGSHSFTSLYIGGGTPSFALGALEDMLQLLRPAIAGEIALETHPLDATVPKLHAMRDMGVNYLSLGVQSFQDRMLGIFGRNHDARQNRKALQKVLGAGFAYVDVDLVFAPDVETFEEAYRDVEEALDWGPSQLSVYPMMRFQKSGMGRSPNPVKEEIRWFEHFEELAASKGYTRNSLWTFSNQPTRAPYSSVSRSFFLGLGLSSASFLPGEFRVNTFSLDNYARQLRAGTLPVGKRVALGAWKSALYQAFWMLYANRWQPGELRANFPGAKGLVWGLHRWLCLMAYLRKQPDGTWVLSPRGKARLHRVEEWLTYRFIDPLWKEMEGF
ncbi:MAG TPA: radical SAM protein [Thermotogota bacterium]|nr:radical SAM protein [Thermotogota bacterium]HRW91562.1 radical SAM protein [Thermotogota bacterium]